MFLEIPNLKSKPDSCLHKHWLRKIATFHSANSDSASMGSQSLSFCVMRIILKCVDFDTQKQKYAAEQQTFDILTRELISYITNYCHCQLCWEIGNSCLLLMRIFFFFFLGGGGCGWLFTFLYFTLTLGSHNCGSSLRVGPISNLVAPVSCCCFHGCTWYCYMCGCTYLS